MAGTPCQQTTGFKNLNCFVPLLAQKWDTNVLACWWSLSRSAAWEPKLRANCCWVMSHCVTLCFLCAGPSIVTVRVSVFFMSSVSSCFHCRYKWKIKSGRVCVRSHTECKHITSTRSATLPDPRAGKQQQPSAGSTATVLTNTSGLFSSSSVPPHQIMRAKASLMSRYTWTQ